MQLNKFNPFNSLFGRVFVWFWTALLVILLSAFFLTKQLSNVLEVNAVSERQALQASSAMQRLTKVVERSDNFNQSLRRLGQRYGLHFVAIDNRTGDLRFSFPMPLASNIDELSRFVETDTPLLIQLNNMEFVGPYALSFKKADYKIFVGRLLQRNERNRMPRSTVTIAGLVLAIFLSTLFCFALVMSITKPIGALRLASKCLAKGDLTTRIHGLENRKDEVGDLAQDFNSMAVRLQSLIDSQKQLMANVSHELRTPLTRLQLAVALLEDELNSSKEKATNSSQNKQMARIESEIVKMDQMIGQVLTLAKINASQQNIDLQEVGLSSLLEGLLQDARFEAEAMQKSLVVGDIPNVTIHADASLFVSAIENIIRNAIRFATTQVTCEFKTTHTSSFQDYVDVCISDDGVGMSASELSTVFDPFFRGSHQVSEVSKGAGLGLSIAKAAIELHGGTICASNISVDEASPLSGLSVIIRLPIVSKTT